MTSPRRLTDPQAVAIDGVDDHLPAIAPRHLTAAAVRARFAAQRDWTAEHAGDGAHAPSGRPAVHAAVLVPLVQRGEALHVLLTKRSEQLRDHAGQISFPGGRSEPEDGSAVATALREAREEIGLAPSCVEIVGTMPTYRTVTGFIVTPVVALVQPPFALALDSAEVAEAFEVPLEHLMNPAHHRRHRVVFEGGQRQFLSMPWRPGAGAADYFIWGATAAMLRNLYRFLAD